MMSSPLGKIAIIGSGAVGGYYGGLLAHHGNDVHFLLRSDYETVKDKGLHIVTSPAPILLTNVNAYRSSEEIGPCDLVIIAVKTTSNHQLKELVAPLLGERTTLFLLQNGLGGDEILADQFGAERVIGGLCVIAATKTAAGEIHHYANGKIDFGEFSGKPLPRTHTLAAELERCRISTTIVENLAEARWKKLIRNVPFNGLSIVAGEVDVSEIFQPPLKDLALELMREVQSAASLLGCKIPDDFIEFQFNRPVVKGYLTSSLVDYQAGRPVEVESIWGEPLRRGKKAGANLPRLEMLYQLLQALDAKNRETIAQ